MNNERKVDVKKVILVILVIVALFFITLVVLGNINNSKQVGVITTALPEVQSKPTPSKFGSSLTLGDSKISIKLDSITDPAKGGLPSKDGFKLASVKFEITNNGSTTYTGNANLNTKAIGSDLQTYTAAFYIVEGCTNFNYGTLNVAPGETSVGCVSLTLPVDTTITKVIYSSSYGSTNTVEWVK